MDFARHFRPKETPQTEKIPGRADQVENSAGGFGWGLDKWARLRRFLILGTEGGTYYATERELSVENATSVLECLREDGVQTIDIVTEVSRGGKAHKNDAALFVLALASVQEEDETRATAYAALPYVARTFHHLTYFLNQRKGLGGGWGTGLRKAINAVYNSRTMRENAYHMTKYRSRNGWTQRDVLLKAHVIDERGRMGGTITTTETDKEARIKQFRAERSSERGAVYGRAAGINRIEIPGDGVSDDYAAAELYLDAFDAAPGLLKPAELADVIRAYRLPREAVPDTMLGYPEVWDALLQDMPITAMIRNLATMTRVGLLKPMGEATRLVCERLGDPERLRKGRVHPIAVLAALLAYSSGTTRREIYAPVTEIVNALDAAFYLSFEAVEPTNKRTLLALDVSGSMGMGEVGGIRGLSPRVASAALALVTAATEERHAFCAFTGGSSGYGFWGRRNAPRPSEAVTPLTISPRQRLDDVVREVSGLPFGGTDCALPILYALEKEIEADSFVIYTDNETWAGAIHPSQALEKYRKESGIDARLVVVGMTSNGFTIADPKDPGMLDVVGMSTDTPESVSAFLRG